MSFSARHPEQCTWLSVVLFFVTCLMRPSAAWAQTPRTPEVGYVFPPVVNAGATTPVMLGGFDWTPDMQWFVHHPAIRLEITGPAGDYQLPPPPFWTGPRAGTNAPPIPREVPARLTIESDVQEGLVRWQVANANGASDTAVFFVSRGQEIVESRSRDFPMQLAALPVGVSGRLSRLTEVDSYSFVADRSGFVTADLMARRLGSDFNGAIEVQDASGRMVADFADTLGLDGAVTFAVRPGQAYTVRIRDTDFRGDRSYVYRLGLTCGPRVIGTMPASVQRGSGESVRLIGMGLDSPEAQLGSLTSNVGISADGSDGSEVQRMAASIHGDMTVMIPQSDHEETICVEDAAPQILTPPIGVTGLFREQFCEKRFQWSSAKEDRWQVRVNARSLNSRMDVSLEILDPEGRRIADNDDFDGSTDARLEFQAPTEGTFTAVVKGFPVNQPDIAIVGNSLDQFRLAIRKAEPDFELLIPSRLSIGLGEKAELPVQVIREGGFSEAIQLQVDNLPEGISLVGEPLIPAGTSDFKLTLQCASDAATTSQLMRLSGTAIRNGTQVTKTARAKAGGHLCPERPEEARIDGTLVAITMKAPFSLQVVDRERQHDVQRGTTFLAELDVVRNEKFTGELRIEMSAKQDRVRMGVRGGILNVAAAETKVFYPVFMPEWLSTDLTRRIVVHGVAVIPDPKGHLRHITNAADARITMIMEGALLKLSAKSPEAALHPGDVVEVPVQISRSPRLALPTTIQLEVPEELRGVLHSEELRLDASQNSGMVIIRTSAVPQLAGPWTWTLRATALQEDRWPVVSETNVSVTFADQ
ncbi:MAG: hypothetical protein ACK58L_10545 [Planctomycetota bacterium]